MLGANEHLAKIVGCEVWPEHQQGREVELAVRDGVEERGKTSDQAGRADAAKRGVFGEAQLVDAVSVQARTSSGAVEATRFDFGKWASSAASR